MTDGWAGTFSDGGKSNVPAASHPGTFPAPVGSGGYPFPNSLAPRRSKTMATFEEALRTQIESKPTRKLRAKRILNILNKPDSARRRFLLKRMENHAAAQLDVNPVGFDWSTVDWSKLFDMLLKILLALLPFLMAGAARAGKK
jgi:hypothetical protein